MKVYLAGAYKRRAEIKEVAEKLRAIGVEVTSKWLEREDTDPSHQNMRYQAYRDILDILAADIVVRFTDVRDSTLRDPACQFVAAGLISGARHFEMGLAFYANKRLVVVGGHQNVFDYLDEVTHVADVEELKEKLTSWQVN